MAATTSNIDLVVIPGSRNDNHHGHHPRSDYMSSTSRYKRLSRSRSPRHRSRSATRDRHSSEGKCEDFQD
jgi:hypothetical protein